MKQLSYIFPLFIFLLKLPAFATDFLEHPLHFVDGDSVMTWAYGGQDFRAMAIKSDKEAKVAKFVVTESMWSEREKLADMSESLQAHLNIAGGGEDEINENQGVPATMNIAANAYMFLLTGSATHIDLMERSLYNAVLHTANDQTLPEGNLDRKAVAEALLAAPGWMYATQGDNLYVNLYSNSTSHIQMQDYAFVLDQITDMPADGRVKFRFMALRGQARHISVHLRMPDWAVGRKIHGFPFQYVEKPKHLPAVFVCGHEIHNYEIDENGYLVIDREWRSTEEIYIVFPMNPQYVRKTSPHTGESVRGEVCIQAGPLVYQLFDDVEEMYFSTNELPTLDEKLTRSGFQVVTGFMRDNKEGKADNQASPIPFEAFPYAEHFEKAGRIWLPEPK